MSLLCCLADEQPLQAGKTGAQHTCCDAMAQGPQRQQQVVAPASMQVLAVKMERKATVWRYGDTSQRSRHTCGSGAAVPLGSLRWPGCGDRAGQAGCELVGSVDPAGGVFGVQLAASRGQVYCMLARLYS